MSKETQGQIGRREFLKMLSTAGLLFLAGCRAPKLPELLKEESVLNSQEPKLKPTKKPPQDLVTEEEVPHYSLENLRGLILEVDETKPEWPSLGEQEGGIPYHDEPTFEGKSVKGRSRLTINTGINDFELVSGGRFAGKNWVISSTVENVRLQGVKHPEGGIVYIDPCSGQILFIKRGQETIIPGGNDDDKNNPYRRGNLIFVLGNKDNTATDLEVDTASNYREKRNTGDLNKGQLDSDGVMLLAAMAKVYANSMFSGSNCKGNGCQDGVGVYILRGGDKNTGEGAELLWAAVLSPEELSQITLRK